MGASGKKKKKSSGLTGRDLWLNAVHEDRLTHLPGRKATAPGHKSQMEFWTGSLRRGFEPIDHQPVSTFTNLHPTPSAIDIPFFSTSNYLRHKMIGGSETSLSTNSPRNPTLRSPVGSRPYRDPEEYCDEIAQLKKMIIQLRGDNDAIIVKYRHLAEENTKKDKQLEKFLDPEKNEELRRLIGNKAFDTQVVVESLKMKLLQCERELSEKTEEISKFHSDVRYTSVRELNIQKDVLYKEVVRLRESSLADLEYAREMSEEKSSKAGKDDEKKTEALVEQIRELNDEKTRLAFDNKSLQEDLKRMMEEQDQFEGVKKDYKDMNRRELLKSIAKLEEEIDALCLKRTSEVKKTDTLKPGTIDTENKIILDGSLRDRLDLLDKRESELMAEVGRLNKAIERLKEDRQHYKQKFEDKSKELDEYIDLFKKEGFQIVMPDNKTYKSSTSKSRRPSSAASGDSRKSDRTGIKVVQRNKRSVPDDMEIEESASVIQSSMRGYMTREKVKESRRQSLSPSDASPDNRRMSVHSPENRRMSVHSPENRRMSVHSPVNNRRMSLHSPRGRRPSSRTSDHSPTRRPGSAQSGSISPVASKNRARPSAHTRRSAVTGDLDDDEEDNLTAMLDDDDEKDNLSTSEDFSEESEEDISLSSSRPSSFRPQSARSSGVTPALSTRRASEAPRSSGPPLTIPSRRASDYQGLNRTFPGSARSASSTGDDDLPTPRPRSASFSLRKTSSSRISGRDSLALSDRRHSKISEDDEDEF